MSDGEPWLETGDDGRQVLSPSVCLGDDGAGGKDAVLNRRGTATEASKANASRSRSRERFLGSLRVHLAVGLSDNGHDADRRFVRLVHVDSDELDASLLQAEQK